MVTHRDPREVLASQYGMDEAQFIADCHEDAYNVARKMFAQYASVETSIVVGVNVGLAGFSPQEKAIATKDLMFKFYGRTHEEVREELGLSNG